jgi:hypothetical protein
MDKNQFQRETGDFMTRNEQEAQNLAAEYNAKGVDGDTVVAAKFGEHWCVILADTLAFTREIGISNPTIPSTRQAP